MFSSYVSCIPLPLDCVTSVAKSQKRAAPFSCTAEPRLVQWALLAGEGPKPPVDTLFP